MVFFLYRSKDIATYVSIFAIGHSVTMIAGVWWSISINAYIIDVIIAFSVVYKELDNLGAFRFSYEQGRAVPEQAGELVAAFTGNHGWFWRNRTDAPVTLTLRTAGEYAEMRAP